MADSPPHISPIEAENLAPEAAADLAFLPTRWSLIFRASRLGADAVASKEALEWLCRNYWRPVYEVVRRRGVGHEDAMDLTQGFFAQLIEKETFSSVDQSRGKFRSWVLGALHHFLLNDTRKAHAQKREAGQYAFSLDFLREDNASAWEPIDAALPPDKAFDRQWALTVLDTALQGLETEYSRRGAASQFEKLKPFLTSGVESGGYDALAAELNTSTNQVAVAVKRLRGRFRERVRSVIAETVLTLDDVEEEMQLLFAALRG